VQSEKQIDGKQPTRDQVRAFLAAHPSFLVENPDLLRSLTPPRLQTGNNVVDFQRFMVDRLQEDIERMHSMRDALISASRSNLASQQQIHEAALAAMDAVNIEHFVHTITGDWVDMLGLDAVALCLETPSKAAGTLLVNGVHVLAEGETDLLLGGEDAVVLRGQVESAAAVFGPAAPLVQAEALVRIEPGRVSPAGVLAMGSRDPLAFAAGQGTELIRFLADVVQRGLDQWLDAQK
jgi:uncharacterized protein YigA (DUF484 family)